MNLVIFLSYILIFLGMIPSFMSEKLRLMSYRKRRGYYLLAILANLVGMILLAINLLNK